jgi:hypothetical protein
VAAVMVAAPMAARSAAAAPDRGCTAAVRQAATAAPVVIVEGCESPGCVVAHMVVA